ncbi:OmpA family protein [Vibrio sp.]|nr:OmpA family protein [Vibrio sp.]
MDKELASILNDAEQGDGWITSYADLISALLAVLLLMASFSKVDIDKFDAVQRSKGQTETQSLKTIYVKLQKIAKENDLESEVQLDLGRNGLEVNFDSVMLFKSGKSRMQQVFLSQIEPVLEAVAEVGDQRYIDVIGHTDNIPFSKKTQQTNWKLSSERAAALHQFLLDQGMPKEGTRLVAYADTMPEVSYEGLVTQEQIEEARSANRRVSVLIGLLK